MANEITLNARFKLINGNLKPGEVIISNLQVDQAAAEVSMFTQNIGTSEEDVSFTGVTTLGWLLMRNLDGTNYVQWGAKDTTMKTAGRLEAGEFAFFRVEPGITLRMVANTAACDVVFYMWGD